jgi:hypothetical protein
MDKQDEIKKKVINIKRIDSIVKDGEVIGFNLFEDEKTKYSFFKTKKDKSQTKAFTQFKEQAIMVGSEIGIAYKETSKEYKDKQGEMRTGINRNIMWFSTPSTMEEYAPRMFEKLPTISEEDKFNNAIDSFEGNDNEIDPSSLPF